MARQKEYNRRRAAEKRKENQKMMNDKETKMDKYYIVRGVRSGVFLGRSLRGTVRKSSCAMCASSGIGTAPAPWNS